MTRFLNCCFISLTLMISVVVTTMYIRNLITVSLLSYAVIAAGPPPPVVLWHGLGDSYNSSGLQNVSATIESSIPDIYVHSIYMDLDDQRDERASFFGNASQDVEVACEQLLEIPELRNRTINLIGFSQGGLLARALIERCPELDVGTFITFGSPHSGVSDGPLCSATDLACKQRNRWLISQVWTNFAQNGIIPAQYFRDPTDYSAYLEHSRFLIDINNEIVNNGKKKNENYVKNFSRLEKFVMVLFKQDETVVPKESAWFYDLDRSTGDVLTFRNTQFYEDDLIGLRHLYDEDKIEFLSIDAKHMVIDDEFLSRIASQYLI